MKSKNISVTMVKNEDTIIEAFIRHTCQYMYKMIIIDNGSTDGTIDILNALIEEGLPITLLDASSYFYDQYLIENKVIQDIIRNESFDFLFPLDADEFLGADGQLSHEIDSLPIDKISIVKWVTYCMMDENESGFFMDRIHYVRQHEPRTFTKVIIPYQFAKNELLFVSMGHHDVESIPASDKGFINTIYIAHFPVRSVCQIQLKIYQGILSLLMSSMEKVPSFHWRQILSEIQTNSFDIISYSKKYALVTDEDNLDDLVFVNKPFHYNPNIHPRFDHLQKKDITGILFNLSEVICIKHLLEKRIDSSKQSLIIYGTGSGAAKLFEFSNSNQYNILCYINSNRSREYSYFSGKIVLAPDKIRYLNYDYVVIASSYYQEIHNTLLQSGVPVSKILSKQEFTQMQISAVKI